MRDWLSCLQIVCTLPRRLWKRQGVGKGKEEEGKKENKGGGGGVKGTEKD